MGWSVDCRFCAGNFFGRAGRKKEEGGRGTLAEVSINTRDFLTKI
jgi:hypothetical protein